MTATMLIGLAPAIARVRLRSPSRFDRGPVHQPVRLDIHTRSPGSHWRDDLDPVAVFDALDGSHVDGRRLTSSGTSEIGARRPTPKDHRHGGAGRSGVSTAGVPRKSLPSST